jgi:Family of unknown function (DUF6290)
MTRTKMLRVRLSDEEWKAIESYAAFKQYTISEVVRDYIKKLPRQDKSSEL